MEGKISDYHDIDIIADTYFKTDINTNAALKEKCKNELVAALLSKKFIIINENYVILFTPKRKMAKFSRNSYGQNFELVKDAYTDLIISTIAKFDVTKGVLFRTYFYNALDNMILHCESKIKKLIDYDEKTIYIDEPIADDTDNTKEIIIYKNDNEDDFQTENCSELIIFTCTCIMKFIGVINKQSNETRKKYFTLFNTETVAGGISELETISDKLLQYENMIISTINLNFLNFFMSDRCKNLCDIMNSTLKKLSEIYEESGEEYNKRCEFPFPYKVYMAYLKKFENRDVSKVIISQQRTNYNKHIKNQFEIYKKM